MVKFFEQGHEYWIGREVNGVFIKERKLMSVTQWCKNFTPIFNSNKVAEELAKKRGVSVASIKAEWTASALNGKTVHKEIEDDLPVTLEATAALSMIAGKKTLREIVIHSEVWGIAGTIDLMIENEDGSITLLDWKTGSFSTSGFNGEKALGRFAKYDNCKLFTASLQLSFYKLLLEAMGYKVRKMVAIHLNGSIAAPHACLDLTEDIQAELEACAL